MIQRKIEAGAYCNLKHVPMGLRKKVLPQLRQAQQPGYRPIIQFVIASCSQKTLIGPFK